MNLLTGAMNALEPVVLPVVAALLLEELTYGGLVRLLVAPWPGTGKRVEHNDTPTPEGTPAASLLLRRKLRERIRLNKTNKLNKLGNLNKLKEQKGEGR
jgi:hypothetical protein